LRRALDQGQPFAAAHSKQRVHGEAAEPDRPWVFVGQGCKDYVSGKLVGMLHMRLNSDNQTLAVCPAVGSAAQEESEAPHAYLYCVPSSSDAADGAMSPDQGEEDLEQQPGLTEGGKEVSALFFFNGGEWTLDPDGVLQIIKRPEQASPVEEMEVSNDDPVNDLGDLLVVPEDLSQPDAVQRIAAIVRRRRELLDAQRKIVALLDGSSRASIADNPELAHVLDEDEEDDIDEEVDDDLEDDPSQL